MPLNKWQLIYILYLYVVRWWEIKKNCGTSIIYSLGCQERIKRHHHITAKHVGISFQHPFHSTIEIQSLPGLQSPFQEVQYTNFYIFAFRVMYWKIRHSHTATSTLFQVILLTFLNNPVRLYIARTFLLNICFTKWIRRQEEIYKKPVLPLASENRKRNPDCRMAWKQGFSVLPTTVVLKD